MTDEALPPPPPLDRMAPQDAGPPPSPPAAFTVNGRKPRPLLGPTLWAYGVGLWAFVALGQFTTKYAPWSSTVPLGGGAAAFWLFAISLAGLVHALRTSFALPSERLSKGRRVALVALAVPGLWISTGLFASLVGSSDAFMTLALLALAIGMTVRGRAWTRALSPAPQGPALVLLFALWAVSGVFTLLVVLQLA